MLLDVAGKGNSINADALRSEVRQAIINRKTNASPICMRIAWHSAGTFDKSDKSGGSDGATMRYAPEKDDGANAGLFITRDLLHPVHKRFPTVSLADLWTFAGAVAVELMGGPRVPFAFGRTDDSDAARCPANGRLPDASQGAQHLREVFGRMGFDDKAIVALSGGHTVGRAHLVRSGFDGPWTKNPLKFDNAYFVELLTPGWTKTTVAETGNVQYERDGMMMLPTDMCLLDDPSFRGWVELYAKDQDAFFRDFAVAYAKLISLGCPESCDPFKGAAEESAKDKESAHFRELAMHGSVGPAKASVKAGAEPHSVEASSGRTAAHKASFWGHHQMMEYLVSANIGIDVNVQDYNGDTCLHDAARFSHLNIAKIIVDTGKANLSVVNNAGMTPAALARDHGHAEMAEFLSGAGARL